MREFLFNVETDEHENKNLINSFPDEASSMKRKLEKWAKDLHHPGIPDGKMVRENGTGKKWYDHYFK